MGVEGADNVAPPAAMEGWIERFMGGAVEVESGNASDVEVTRSDFSTARRYFPMNLYCSGRRHNSQTRCIVNGGLINKHERYKKTVEWEVMRA